MLKTLVRNTPQVAVYPLKIKVFCAREEHLKIRGYPHKKNSRAHEEVRSRVVREKPGLILEPTFYIIIDKLNDMGWRPGAPVTTFSRPRGNLRPTPGSAPLVFTRSGLRNSITEPFSHYRYISSFAVFKWRHLNIMSSILFTGCLSAIL